MRMTETSLISEIFASQGAEIFLYFIQFYLLYLRFLFSSKIIQSPKKTQSLSINSLPQLFLFLNHILEQFQRSRFGGGYLLRCWSPPMSHLIADALLGLGSMAKRCFKSLEYQKISFQFTIEIYPFYLVYQAAEDHRLLLSISSQYFYGCRDS